MAVRAHLDLQIVTEGRARLERVPARAGDGDLFVLRVDSGFHGGLTLSQKTYPVSGVPGAQIKGRASLAAVARALKRLERGRLSRKGHYPQKLWTTLWTASVALRRSRRSIAFLLP
jgi:hypothetical protein